MIAQFIIFVGVWLAFAVWYWFVIFRDPGDVDRTDKAYMRGKR